MDLQQAAEDIFCFWAGCLSRLEKSEYHFDQSVFGLLTGGGLICVGGFSLMLTDFATVRLLLVNGNPSYILGVSHPAWGSSVE